MWNSAKTQRKVLAVKSADKILLFALLCPSLTHWSRTRFKPLLKSVEFSCFQLIALEPKNQSAKKVPGESSPTS